MYYYPQIKRGEHLLNYHGEVAQPIPELKALKLYYGEYPFQRTACVLICIQRWIFQSPSIVPALFQRFFLNISQNKTLLFCLKQRGKKPNILLAFFFFSGKVKGQKLLYGIWNWLYSSCLKSQSTQRTKPTTSSHLCLTHSIGLLLYRTRIFAERSLLSKYSHHAKTKRRKLNREHHSTLSKCKGKQRKTQVLHNFYSWLRYFHS